jgi:hypothetical protein
MRELHDLARELGIDVPLLANNNTCCIAAGAWHVPGDDGQPIVDIPAEDNYPCAGICSPTWDRRIFHTVDALERRLRSAGVTHAPIAVAELQGGYFTGWGGPSYARLDRALGSAFAEVLEGSVLGQGATILSTYMAAGGTSWRYLAGPNTATSYDDDAALHEWSEPSPTYGALKRQLAPLPARCVHPVPGWHRFCQPRHGWGGHSHGHTKSMTWQAQGGKARLCSWRRFQAWTKSWTAGRSTSSCDGSVVRVPKRTSQPRMQDVARPIALTTWATVFYTQRT